MFGISLARREFPDVLIARHRLTERITRRNTDADEEVQFFDCHRVRVLPVWIDGQLLILPWKGWQLVESLRAGQHGGEEGLIPATFCYDSGVWYTSSGIRCSVVRGIAYPINQPSSHYYEVMTRQKRMPLFAGEQI